MIADWEINCVFLATMLKDRHPDLFRGLQEILISHGIHVGLLEKGRDIWVKDYAPVQVDPGKLIKFRYDPDYLRQNPEMRTGNEVVKAFRTLGRCHQSDIILDGGNVIASKTKAILTAKIYKENPGWSRSDLRNRLQELLQVNQLIVVPKESFDPFGHSDSMLRFIDEDTVLVNDYAASDPDFGEKLLKVLRRNHLAIEHIPYVPEMRSRGGIPSAVGCYTNFLRTEKVLVAPVFGMKQDHIALRKLKAVFPGLSIVPLNCTDLARDGGIVNCISGTFNISQKKQ
jgi:agmatine deiminase